jgi:hypothetical protein
MTEISELLKTKTGEKQDKLDKFASRLFYLLEEEVKSGRLSNLDCLGVMSNLSKSLIEQQGGYLSILDKENLD